jgi:peptidoglycan/xylan/chitin deacetylase (PgdA/CDA1 family)
MFGRRFIPLDSDFGVEDSCLKYPHERPFAPIHNRIPYVPLPERPEFEWPGGHTVAVWVVPNVEHYEYLPPAQAVDPYPRTPHPDVRLYSYRDYGNRVGFWRMAEVLERYEIPATVSLNVGVLDLYPEVGEEILRLGWDLLSHGWYNTRELTGLSRDDEKRLLELCNEVLERHTGQRFRGMLGPNISANSWTPDVMAELGMDYHADWVHDERPTPLGNDVGRPMVALPYTYELNDAPLLMRSHVEGSTFVDLWLAQIDRLRQEGRGGRVACLVLHPFAIGQPHRIEHLERLLDRLRSFDDVWIATAAQIVDHYMKTGYDKDVAALAR